MNNKQKLNFIAKETEAISEEFEILIKKISLLNDFIKDVSKIAISNNNLKTKNKN